MLYYELTFFNESTTESEGLKYCNVILVLLNQQISFIADTCKMTRRVRLQVMGKNLSGLFKIDNHIVTYLSSKYIFNNYVL